MNYKKFSEEEVIKDIEETNRYLSNLQDTGPDKPPYRAEMLKYLHLMMDGMLVQPSHYDQCTSTKEEYLDLFINYIKTLRSGSVQERETSIHFAFITACRFYFESLLYIPVQTNQVNLEVKDFLFRLQHINDPNIPAGFDSQLRDVIYGNHIRIIENYFRNSNCLFPNKVSEILDRSAAQKILWDKEFSEKRSEVEDLFSQLKKIRAGANFVALSDAFSKILQKKTEEIRSLLSSLKLLGTSLIITPGAVIISAFFKQDFSQFLLLASPAIISIEIILLYFFRLIYSQHKSLKTQIIQLELRRALCEFIDSYSDFSKNLKDKNIDALQKFESLIFSNILVNEESLPSTFDGMEQISKMIKTIKG